jgi:3-oxoacyl-[acyl-carrier protein] reductase
MKRTALVTGASRGVGAATAAELGSRGYHVIVNYRENETAARAVVEGIESAGGTAEAARADVTESTDVAELVARCARIDLVVCNANIQPTFGPLSMTDWATFSEKVLGELAAVFHVTQKALAIMREQRSGQIVYVSSLVADAVIPYTISHATAKSALNAFAQRVACEAGPDGVAVNSVALGWVRTEGSGPFITPELDTAHTTNSVLGHLMEPEDVASVIATIADGGLRAVTGAHIPVDGGFRIMVPGSNV